MITPVGLLFIEPKAHVSMNAIVDSFTRIMAGALSHGTPGTFDLPEQFWPGSRHLNTYTCSCGVSSTNQDYKLPGGEVTNSLAVHYLAWHRDEIDSDQLQRVVVLPSLPMEPTEKQLLTPPRMIEIRRQNAISTTV